MQVDTGNSILSEITKTEMSKKVGHFGYILTYLNNEGWTSLCVCDKMCILFVHAGQEAADQVVVKSKTTAIETCNMLNRMAQACGLELAIHYQKYKMLLGFK